MKNKIFIFSILLFGAYMLKGQPVRLILSTPESGTKEHLATKSISFESGYTYTPGSGTLTANIVEPTIENMSYNSTVVDPTTRTISTTSPYVVGTIQGAVNVNAMGAATYTIPIDLPPGVNGLQPSISLNYSSMGGPGVAGLGWQIAGISAISRSPKTYYQYGQTNGINADTTDRFSLDGQSLVRFSGDYGLANSEYRTESETFSRVTALGTVGSGPDNFKVETKSGYIYQYGNTVDSKQHLNKSDPGSTILSWFVNSITDLFGNTMLYDYMENEGNLYISTITYGSNQVVFYYKERGDLINSYFKGVKFQQKLILDKIEVRYKDNILKTYQLKYNYLTNYYYYLSILNEVIEFGTGDTRFNSTAFSYSQVDQATFEDADWYTESYISSNSILYSGDFNGDGHEDILALSKSDYRTTRLYIRDAGGGFTLYQTTQFPLNYPIVGITICDLNGDGKDDAITTIQAGPVYSYYFQVSNGTTLSSHTSFALNIQDFSIPNPNFENRISDFDGDGFNDFLIMHIGDNEWEMFSFTKSTINTNLRGNYRTGNISSWGNQVYIADFNGDGKSDLWVFESNALKIYSLSTSGSLDLIHSVSWISSNNKFQLGDFNGDGKTDILVYGNGSTDWYNWQMYLSTGTGFDYWVINQLKANLKDDKVIVRDFNGDGHSDILALSKNVDNTPRQYHFISNLRGNDFIGEWKEDINMSKDNNYVTGDFDGNGKPDVLTTANGNGYRISSTTGNTDRLLRYIGDGLGQVTRIDYNNLTNDTFYDKGSEEDVFPVFTYQGPLTVATGLLINNGYGPTMSYKYSGLKIHRQGKGFLGYEKTTVEEGISDILTESQFSYDTVHYSPQLTTLTKRSGYNDMSVTTNEYDYTDFGTALGHKRYFPYISSTTEQNVLTNQSINSTFEYDSYGNPTSIYKNYGNRNETTSNTVVNIVDSNNWLLGRVTNSSTTFAGTGNSITKETNRSYSSTTNQITSETYFPSTSSELTKSFEYYANGNLQNETLTADNVSRTTQYEYNIDNVRVSKITDPLDHEVNRTYNDYGLLESETDFLNNSVTYTYDEFGRQNLQTNADGSTVTTNMNWYTTGEPANARYNIEKLGNDGSRSLTWYDKLKQEIRTDVKGFNGNMIAILKTYSPIGQLESVSEPYYDSGSPTQSTTYTYDDYGRPSGISRFNGSSTSYAYNNNEVTETTDNRSFTKTFNGDGSLAQAEDEGGTLVYTYYPDGKTYTISNGGATAASMTYDIAGNQTSLTDQSAGEINYTYTKFGELKTQVTARDNNTTTLNYYDDGRLYTKVIPEGTTTYSYNGNKQLTSISSPGSVSRSQTYDSKGRIETITETIDGSNYQTTLAYDNIGRLDTRTHPSGIVEKNIYNNYGYLYQVKADNVVMWTVNSMDERQKVRTANYGSGSSLGMTFTPDTYGYPASVQTGTVHDYRYSFNAVTGNLTSRQDYLRSKSESFSYDDLYRLTGVTGPQNLTMTYADNGNISSKSDFGVSYSYNDSMFVSNSPENYAANQAITYTTFQKINTISEGNYSAEFVYNSDYDRAKMVVSGPNLSLTRIYAGSRYMKETLNSVTKEYTFIGGDAYSAPCVIEKSGLTTTPHFLLRDHLGSIIYVANNSGTIEYEYSYDAWGRQRNPTSWSTYTVDNEPSLFIGRGYTGHEHLPWFNLINMNGRLYDPVVGRFLSPDNYVSSPDFSQGYNRYAYCVNNPMKFKDPDGEWFWIVAMAIAGAYLGGVSANHGELNPVSWEWDTNTFIGVGFGAAFGAAGGYWIEHPGAFVLDIGIKTQYAQAGILISGAAGVTGNSTGWNYNLHWTTAAGGGGNVDLKGKPKTSAEQKVNQAIAEANVPHGGGGGTFSERIFNEFINYSESTIDGLTYTVTGLGADLSGGFRNMKDDWKYNGAHMGEGRWFPGKYDPVYAYGFTFENGFIREAIDQNNVSWSNGKRIMNGTLGIVLFPLEISKTGYKVCDFLIDQAITGGIGYGVGKGLDKIPNY